MVIIELVSLVQILGKAIHISFYANALGKGMNLSILPATMDE